MSVKYEYINVPPFMKHNINKNSIEHYNLIMSDVEKNMITNKKINKLYNIYRKNPTKNNFIKLSNENSEVTKSDLVSLAWNCLSFSHAKMFLSLLKQYTGASSKEKVLIEYEKHRKELMEEMEENNKEYCKSHVNYLDKFFNFMTDAVEEYNKNNQEENIKDNEYN